MFFLMAYIQHNRRYENFYHVHGIDMRGVDDVTGMKGKIKWIRNHRHYNPSKDPYKILLAWEQRDAKLDKQKS